MPQLVAAATSVGGNYCEADEAESKKDFRHKICISKKEAHESKHYLRMVVRAQPDLKPEAASLWQEAKELTLIFAVIVRRCGGEAESGTGLWPLLIVWSLVFENWSFRVRTPDFLPTVSICLVVSRTRTLHPGNAARMIRFPGSALKQSIRC